MKRLLSIVLLLVLVTAAVADAPSGDKIIAAMRKQFGAVNDYRADVSLTVKGDRVSINNMHMTVFYKKPNRIHIDATQGMAINPGGNYFGDPLSEMTSTSHATYVRVEKKLGRECYLLQLQGPRSPLQLWVDKERLVMLAVESSDGMKSTWSYDKIDGKYYLPTQITADMQPQRFGMRHRRQLDPDETDDRPMGPTKVTIKFSNYEVNKGIDDKIFEEKKRK